MKVHSIVCVAIVALLVLAMTVFGGCGRKESADEAKNRRETATQVTPVLASSVAAEARAALEKAAAWLVDQQSDDGSFGGLKEFGATAMAVAALAQSPQANREPVRRAIERGVQMLLDHQRPDGAFTMEEGRGLETYRTSLGILALSAVDDQKYSEEIARARDFLVMLQAGPASGADPERDKNFFGGFNYQEEKGRADLSNTQMALEALHAAGLPADSPVWNRAIVFLNRCQNRSESNDTGHAGNDGGGIYAPNETKVQNGIITLPDGTTIYQSYGSMTYALLKCFIFAGLPRDDARVQAACNWIRNHYTVDENPNMGAEGLYYYYATMATALDVYGEPAIVTPDGRENRWAEDLALKLVELQQPDGSWVNKADRWMEAIPVLATSYAVLALDTCLQYLEEQSQ